MKDRGEQIFNISVLLVTLAFVVAAFAYPPKARLLPLVVGGPALALMVYQVATNLVSKGDSKEPLAEDARRRQGTILLWIAVLAIVVYILGLTLGVGIFLLAFLRWVGRRGWALSAAVALGGSVLVYGLFGQVLHYPLYAGLVGLI